MRQLFSNWADLSSHAGAMLMAPTILAIGILSYSHFSWNKQMIEDIPLLDVVMEIKVELERTHMHLHEIERSIIVLPSIKDQEVLQEQHDHLINNIDHVLESLTNLDVYISQMHTGTTVMGNVTLSRVEAKKTSDETLNKHLNSLQTNINTLREYLNPRLQGDAYQSFIYDSENDVMFEEALEFAQLADDRVHEITKEKIAFQRRVFLLFMLFFGLLTVFFVAKWKKLKDNHQDSLADLYLTTAAIAQSEEAIIVADRNGIIEYVNNSFSEVTGYESDQITGQDLSVLDAGKHSIMDDALPFVLDEIKWQLEVNCKDSQGRSYRSHTTVSPILDSSGNVAFCEIRQKLL